MTDAEIDALECGEDLDLLVADACRITAGRSCEGGIGVCRQQDDGTWTKWEPSIDWNDAMFAAERFVMSQVCSYPV